MKSEAPGEVRFDCEKRSSQGSSQKVPFDCEKRSSWEVPRKFASTVKNEVPGKFPGTSQDVRFDCESEVYGKFTSTVKIFFI